MTPRAPISWLPTLAAVLALAASVPASAGFDYLMLGDSITQGVCDSGPGQCPVHFCNMGTGSNGYPSRLASSLSCTLDPLPPDNLCGSGCCLVNAGLSGDKTAQMLTRFQGITGTYDVVVIMGGTNDVFGGISNNTIQFNYEQMDDHAVSRGIDPLLASIIRFRDDVSTPAINNTVLDLRNRIQSLAVARNRWFADPWTPLCPTGGCFDLNYYQPGGPDPVGHPNGCGYDIMSNLFFNLIDGAALPAGPIPDAPNGDITDATPLLEWTAAADATWHEVQIDSGVTWSDLSQLADSCTGSDCSVVSPALAAGAHTWRVRGRNPKGFGAWASRAFELVPPPPPAQIYPVDTETFDPTPLFRWIENADATEYRVEVRNTALTTVWDSGLVAASGLCNGVCEIPSANPLAFEAHSWRVRAKSPVGEGSPSAWQSFTVLDCSAFPDVPLPPPTAVAGTETHKACTNITVGPSLLTVQGPNGDLTLHAGGLITIERLEVESGAELVLQSDP